MNTRKIIAGIVLIDFAALNAYALYAEGLSGFVTWLTTLSPWAMVIFADLLIALFMVLFWMWRDAKANGRNPMVYTIVTFLTGSIGPLLYMLMGHTSEAPEAVVAPEPEAA